jgi:hypothetical protein
MPHHNPPPNPPRRSLLDQITYGLCILIIWIMAAAAVLNG